MRTVEAEGRSVDEAVQLALAETGWSSDDVDVEVLQGGAGRLGWLGARRRTRVRVSLRTNKLEVAAAFLREMARVMGLGPLAVETTETLDYLLVDARGPGLGLLIGRRGAILEDLERIVNAVAGRAAPDRRRVLVDIEGYRRKREDTLERLAARLAERVRRTGAPATLEPMKPSERRVIHLALRDSPYVNTRSEGEEPRRRVVISPAGGDSPRREGRP
ncbi:MAG: RNA-binding cell elongation regulator Jag/EloR [bacterium]|nr:RNA-binding cell elongation regulator Jag/EloR [bacterium]